MLSLIFPRKCVICGKILEKNQLDLCHSCRIHTQEYFKGKRSLQFVAKWTALWYYSEDVRKSILRFKFYNRRSYADAYARLLGVKLLEKELMQDVDILTWVPVSFRRRLSRGYDQCQLIATALGKELGMPAQRVLRKIRHTPPQSSLQNASQRRANVMGAYRVSLPDIKGKRILLIDDILTTGSTASECAKVLLTAGAKEVYFAAVATATNDKSIQNR